MPFTPNYSAGDVLTAAAVNSIGEAWGTFGTTANFKAVTTNPTLGTGGTWAMNYCQLNKVVFVRGRITWGGSGLNQGSGAYRVDLPVTAKSSTAGATWGVGTLYDAAGLESYPFFVLAPNTTQFAIYPTIVTGTPDTRFRELKSDAKPFAWSNGSFIDYSFTYEAA